MVLVLKVTMVFRTLTIGHRIRCDFPVFPFRCRLAHSGHRRQLLGEHTCSDPRWGPLCGRVQLLLQLADGELKP